MNQEPDKPAQDPIPNPLEEYHQVLAQLAAQPGAMENRSILQALWRREEKLGIPLAERKGQPGVDQPKLD